MTNRWLARRVLAYAHQGGALEAPSSTLHALRLAIEAGADALELDVHATADGELVVCHDTTVDRTTDGSGAIADLSLDEIRRLDNAYWFVLGEGAVVGRPEGSYALRGRAPKDPDLRVATLGEVLDAFPDIPINLDIKQTAPTVRPYEELLARTLAEHGRDEGVIVASFLDAATDSFSRFAPDVATSAGTLAVAEFWRAVQSGEPVPELRHSALQVPAAVGETAVVDERFVEAAHRAGLAVHVWTIDEAGEMARLVGQGVDGIISDRPSVLSRVLSELGVRWRG